MANWQNKTPQPSRPGRNERVANTAEPPVVVPVVVVAVDVHVALIIVPPIERDELYKMPSSPPPLENSIIISRLNLI